MPRDANGSTQPLPGTIVSTGDTVLPSQHNPMVVDVYAMMTQSLSRDGQGGMRANLDFSTFKAINLAAGTASGDGVNKSQLDSAVLVGALQAYAGQVAPSGWLMCYGQAVSRTTYSALFAVIGTVFGVGDGSTTFNVPDLRGRALAGSDNMGGVSAGRLTVATIPFGPTFSQVGGAESIQLTADQNGTHNHGVTDPGHAHTYNSPAFTVDFDRGGTASLWSIDQNTTPATNPATTGISIQNSGSGNPHNNVQPTMLITWLIRSGV